jgi:hypothetical protein
MVIGREDWASQGFHLRSKKRHSDTQRFLHWKSNSQCRCVWVVQDSRGWILLFWERENVRSAAWGSSCLKH